MVDESLKQMTRVDATLDFEFIGHLEGHKVNCGQYVGFNCCGDLNSM